MHLAVRAPIDLARAAQSWERRRKARRETFPGRVFLLACAAMSDPASKALFARACAVIPGGVNSPVRAFRAVGGEPVFIARAAGTHI